jgi:hypothetical protein
LLAELSPRERDALLAHELAHVRRRDDLVRWLEVLTLVAFWWNPVAWFARRKLRDAEEECCDAWVVWALPAERKSYAQAMLATIEFLTDGPPLPALAASTFGGALYKRRIEMIMKRNVNRRISWAALGMIVLSAVAVLPIVGQTKSADETQKGAQPDDPPAASSADAAPAPGPIADPLPDATANERGSGAVDSTSSPSSDPGAAAKKNVAEPNPNQSGNINRANAGADRQDVSTEAILQRISRLEQLLERIVDNPGVANPLPRTGGSSRATNRNVPSGKQEQDLDEELLKLDVAAAKADIEPARIKWERSRESNRKQPGSVSQLLVEQQRAELFQKQVQLKRAETLLERHQRQAQRRRDEAESSLQRSVRDSLRNRELTEARRRAERADQLARLKEKNKQIADELLRLEKLLKESPDAPETWRAVEEFLKSYRNSPEGTESDSSLNRYPGGFAN